jgi:hypothetical protein
MLKKFKNFLNSEFNYIKILLSYNLISYILLLFLIYLNSDKLIFILFYFFESKFMVTNLFELLLNYLKISINFSLYYYLPFLIFNINNYILKIVYNYNNIWKYYLKKYLYLYVIYLMLYIYLIFPTLFNLLFILKNNYYFNINYFFKFSEFINIYNLTYCLFTLTYHIIILKYFIKLYFNINLLSILKNKNYLLISIILIIFLQVIPPDIYLHTITFLILLLIHEKLIFYFTIFSIFLKK